MCKPPVLLSLAVNPCVPGCSDGVRGRTTQRDGKTRGCPRHRKATQCQKPWFLCSNLGFCFSEEPCLKFLSKILS
uniref:Uncharacterized protein n=1 Tax=Rangifer tarandus platyrhynchus TaxID=3082113 RepID=A0ACB0EXI3_RANTA|nr:unnamed protein product [Rangifer tarandus platyrhynchus]